MRSPLFGTGNKFEFRYWAFLFTIKFKKLLCIFFGMSNSQQFGATNKEYIEATYIQKKKKN